MSGMKRLNQRGSSTALLLSLVTVSVLLVAALSFGGWAWSKEQKYKNHSDQLVAQAVASEKQSVQKADAASYAEAAKQPLKTYVGPSAYGSLQVAYPKTWSAYVAEDATSGSPVDGYFEPNVVPNVTDQTSIFALRVQVVATSYDQVLQEFTSAVQQKTATVTSYALPRLPQVVGVRIDGTIAQNKQGSMIVLPLRDKTLKIWTEASQFESD